MNYEGDLVSLVIPIPYLNCGKLWLNDDIASYLVLILIGFGTMLNQNVLTMVDEVLAMM